jgi:hypothetical protein
MALVISQSWTAISGSVGGITWARSSQGYYMRSRVTPVNPNTSYQQQIRSALTTLASRWGDTLSTAQRTAWNTYAGAITVINRLGQSVLLSGQQWFTACNSPRIQADAKIGTSLGIIDDGPTTLNRGDPGSLSITSLGAAAGVVIGVAGSPLWSADDDAYALVFQGKPVGAGRNFFAGPYRLIHAESGNSGVPVTSIGINAGTFTSNGWTLVEGQKSAIVVAIAQADGRLSSRVNIELATIAA